MKSPKNKLYVDIKTGGVYHKPEKVNGLAYEPPKRFYEITEEQAARITGGEALGDVLREGIREKVESELNSVLPSKEESPETPAAASEGAEEAEVEGVQGLKTHKEVDMYAKEKGLEIPSECINLQSKKDFISTALLTS